MGAPGVLGVVVILGGNSSGTLGRLMSSRFIG
jgi:hypothetical protein